jgi:hypothetical protein
MNRTIKVWKLSTDPNKFDAWWETVGETVGDNVWDIMQNCQELLQKLFADKTVGGVSVPAPTKLHPEGERFLFANPAAKILQKVDKGSAKIHTELKTKSADGQEISTKVTLDRHWDYSGPTEEGAASWGSMVPRCTFPDPETKKVVFEFPKYTDLGLVDDHRFWEIALPLPHATAPGIARPTQMVWVAPDNENGNAAFVSRYNATYEAWNHFADNSYSSSAIRKEVSQEKLYHPVVEVCFWDCVLFAEWAGFTIPTQPEWVFASRGNDTRDFPWGNEEPCEGLVQMNDEVDANAVITPSGYLSAKRPAGHGRYGVNDKCGNAWEWTSTPHNPGS